MRAVVAAKFAASNLLPLPGMNGGAAIALLARQAGLDLWWPAKATQALLWVWVVIMVCWLLALGVYFTGS